MEKVYLVMHCEPWDEYMPLPDKIFSNKVKAEEYVKSLLGTDDIIIDKGCYYRSDDNDECCTIAEYVVE